MPQYTSRLSLPFPDADNSESPAGPAQIEALAAAIDDAAIYSQGILSSRPVSTSDTPGIAGRLYYVIGDATPANNGIMWLDFGTGWQQVNAAGTVIDLLAARPAASAVLPGTRFFATDQVSEHLSDGTTWIRLGDQPGEVMMCLGATADPGHILLQGQAWPSTSGIYADLFDKLGGTHLPDFGGFTAVGFKASDPDFGTLLANVGEKKHTLTIAEMPAHHHTFRDPGASLGTGGAGGVSGPNSTQNTGDTGGGLSHNNIQPSRVVNFQAKL
jgi:microcystin-dependent protein